MNNSLLRFTPVFPMTFAIALALSLLVFFVYKEFQRTQKFLILRIVALSLVMISLLGILLHPVYQKEKETDSILLLTKGYQPNKVDSIIQANPKLNVIRTTDAASYGHASILKSWYDLRDENIICVMGQGIPGHALDLIQNKRFQFIPASTPQGITKLIVPNDIDVNHRRQIQGTFNASEKTKLKLLGPGGVEDSVALEKGDLSFSLSFTPRQSGFFMYKLVADNLRGSTSIERLPIQVMPARQLRILFVEKQPTSEVKFLKNFLAEKNHQLALRHQISKMNYTYEYANMPHEPFHRLHSNFLSSFDMLFIDQKSYDELSALEQNELRKSINNGLGVILLLHNETEKVISEFLPVQSKISLRDTAHVLLSSHVFVFPVLPIELRNDPSILSFIKNKNRVLSGYVFSGQGRIGFQFIQETFRLAMEGHLDEYSLLWTNLIENTARARESNFKLKLITPFPYYPNEPVDISAGSSGLPPTLYADSVIISMKENALVDDYWRGRSWAGKSGWHQFRIRQDSTHFDYFVSDTSEWKTLRISNQIKVNTISQNIPNNEHKKIAQQASVPPLLFYFIFLFSSAFLWLAPKI